MCRGQRLYSSHPHIGQFGSRFVPAEPVIDEWWDRHVDSLHPPATALGVHSPALGVHWGKASATTSPDAAAMTSQVVNASKQAFRGNRPGHATQVARRC